MIVIDQALRRRQFEQRPIQVAIVGAGYMGAGIIFQITSAVPGMRVAVVVNRTLARAQQALASAGITTSRHVHSPEQLDAAIAAGETAITADPQIACAASGIEVVFEVTGDVEFGAGVSIAAIANGKHLILMNAELDATLGPILQVKARQARVVYSNSDGDQPGVIMNLVRFAQSLGCRPVLAGNMKALQDCRRTPATQASYARRFNLSANMATAFADGSKIAMEMAVVANATGFRTGKRGMYGPCCEDINDALQLFPPEQMLAHGLVDYVLGAKPAAGVFVIAYNNNAMQQQYLRYYKRGDGPFYLFYTPYHLCHLEAPLTAARAVLFADAAIAPLGAPVCEVIAIAKENLSANTLLDGIGGFCCYGVLENAAIARGENLLPLGLAATCRLRHDLRQDQLFTYDDVELPPQRLADELRQQQNQHFADDA